MADGPSHTPEGEMTQQQSSRNNKFKELGKRLSGKVKKIVNRNRSSVPGGTTISSNTSIETPSTTLDPFDNIQIINTSPPETLNLPPEFNIPNASEDLPAKPLPATIPENSADIIAYLSAKNPFFDYSEVNLTPQQVKHAMEFAESKGWDKENLSPAQLQLAQIYRIGEITAEEAAYNIVEQRVDRVTEHQAELLPILLPQTNTYVHATGDLNNVEGIIKNGLYCHEIGGLDGVAVRLDKKSKLNDELLDKQVIKNNIDHIAESHRGYRFVVVMSHPDLTAEQQTDFAKRRAAGEHVNPSEYFIKPLQQTKGGGGAMIEYNAVFPAEYVSGYIDLETAKFHPKSSPLLSNQQ